MQKEDKIIIRFGALLVVGLLIGLIVTAQNRRQVQSLEKARVEAFKRGFASGQISAWTRSAEIIELQVKEGKVIEMKNALREILLDYEASSSNFLSNGK